MGGHDAVWREITVHRKQGAGPQVQAPTDAAIPRREFRAIRDEGIVGSIWGAEVYRLYRTSASGACGLNTTLPIPRGERERLGIQAVLLREAVAIADDTVGIGSGKGGDSRILPI